MAEEKKFSFNSSVHYSLSEFTNRIDYSIAHEIGHLITVERGQNKKLNERGHLLNNPNTLMSDTNTMQGLTNIFPNGEELGTVYLDKPLSVNHGQ